MNISTSEILSANEFLDEEKFEDLIDNIISNKDKNEIKKFFEQNIIQFKEFVELNGLNEASLTKIVDFLITSNLVNFKFKKLLECLIPQTTFPEDLVEKIILWLISKFNYKNEPYKANAILEWINGLIEYNLIEISVVDDYYHLLFPLLGYPQMARNAAKLIYRLVRLTDVSLDDINTLKRAFKITPQPHYQVLLRLFRTYRADLIPEYIPYKNPNTAFKPLSNYYKNAFERAQKRCGNLGGKNEQYSNPTQSSSSGKKESLIPSCTSVEFTSPINQVRRSKYLLQFKSIPEMIKKIDEIKEPSQTLALLNSLMGFNYLIFSPHEIKIRFSFTLYHTLNKVFILEETSISYNEKKEMLNQIIKFLRILQHGLPVVSAFLADYLKIWDFDDFFIEILQLLEFVLFSSNVELYSNFFYPIQMLFLGSEISMKIKIIEMLGNLVERFILFHAMKSQPLYKSFLDMSQYDYPFVSALESVMKFVDKICQQALNIESEHQGLLHIILQVYEKISILEMKFELPTITITPPGVTYRCMFSNNVTFVSKISSLMESYLTILCGMENIDPEELTATMKENLHMISMYLNDFWHFIILGKAHENEAGYFKKSHLEIISKKIQSPFDLTNHTAFLPSLATLMKKYQNSPEALIKREDILNQLHPSIRSLHVRLSEYLTE